MKLLLTFLLINAPVWAESKPNQGDGTYEKIQKCIEQVQNLCKEDKDKNCPQKKWPELPADCKEYSDTAAYMNPDNIASGNIPGPMGDCLKQIHKLCTFDNKLALKDLEKAGKKYQACVEKSVSKLTGECKKLMNMTGQ